MVTPTRIRYTQGGLATLTGAGENHSPLTALVPWPVNKLTDTS